MGKRARGGRAGKTQTLHIRNVFREAERKTVCDLAHREFKNVSQKLGTEGPSPVSEPATVDTEPPSQLVAGGDLTPVSALDINLHIYYIYMYMFVVCLFDSMKKEW